MCSLTLPRLILARRKPSLASPEHSRRDLVRHYDALYDNVTQHFYRNAISRHVHGNENAARRAALSKSLFEHPSRTLRRGCVSTRVRPNEAGALTTISFYEATAS